MLISGCHCSEYDFKVHGGTRFFVNFGTYLRNCKASHNKRLILKGVLYQVLTLTTASLDCGDNFLTSVISAKGTGT